MKYPEPVNLYLGTTDTLLVCLACRLMEKSLQDREPVHWFLQWAKFDSDNSPGFLARAFDSEFDWLSIVFAILGLLVLLCAFFVNRRDRQLREFEEALKRSNQP